MILDEFQICIAYMICDSQCVLKEHSYAIVEIDDVQWSFVILSKQMINEYFIYLLVVISKDRLQLLR